MPASPHAGVRLILRPHAGVGLILLLAPGACLRRLRVPDSGAGPRRVVQVLGLRHLAAAALMAARPTRSTARLCGAVDLTHAATMAALAARSRSYRRAATASLAVSGALGLTELRRR